MPFSRNIQKTICFQTVHSKLNIDDPLKAIKVIDFLFFFTLASSGDHDMLMISPDSRVCRQPYHPAAQDWLPTEAKQG